jgi:hypothetical protein
MPQHVEGQNVTAARAAHHAAEGPALEEHASEGFVSLWKGQSALRQPPAPSSLTPSLA